MERRRNDPWSNATDGILSVESIQAFVEERSLSWHLAFLDDIAVGLSPHDFVVIGAETGAGKTSLGSLMAMSASRAGKRVHYIALEAFAREIESRLLFAEMSRIAWQRSLPNREQFSYWRWFHGYCHELARAVMPEAKERMLVEAKGLRVLYGGGAFDTIKLVEAIDSLKGKSDLVILDHLHFVEHDAQTDNVGMRQVVKAISCSVKDSQVPVIAIAHLRKRDRRAPTIVPSIDDFHGTSDIVKIATRVVVMAPARDREQKQRGIFPTYMRVAKDRFCGASPYTALLHYDAHHGRYYERYVLGRLNPAMTEWSQLAARDMPPWAQHATHPGA